MILIFEKLKKRSDKAGLPPGTLIFMGERKIEEEKITIIDYNKEKFQMTDIKLIEKELNIFDDSIIRWINVDGLGQINNIEKLGKQFQLHPLLLEDVVDPHQRSKIENFESHLFIVLKMLRWDKEQKKVMTEQISMVLGPDYVITFREFESDLFIPIIERIRQSKGQVRIMGADYLIYVLLDIIIDNYFVILEKIGKRLDEIEEELVENPRTETLRAIHQLKREIITLRKLIWPSRNVVNGLQRESLYINNITQIYLRDSYDNILSIIDTFENYRDVISSMLDIYLSSISNKMNEIMKILTIISTIFIPLSFLAGFYGMNFLYMPELKSPVGYPILIIVMISISILMLIFFRRKGWL
ncbi:MAG: magnesium/cobalt transporter CorA [Promethearchaeota archaeon]